MQLMWTMRSCKRMLFTWWEAARELVAVATPLIISSSFWTIEITVDRMFLSWYHPLAVGAAVQATMVFWTAFVLFHNCAGYVTTFVAQYYGAGQFHRIGCVVWQALYFSVASGLMFLAWIPLAPLTMASVVHDLRMQEWGSRYLICLCYSALPTLVSAAVSGFFAGRGDCWTVLLINGVGMLANVVLDYLLIFGGLGLPALGVLGAGIATILSAWLSAGVGLILYWRKPYRKLYDTWGGWKWNGRLMLRLLRFGIPAGLQWWFDTLAWTVFLVVIGWMGAVELSATSIAFAINTVAFVPMLGFGQAVMVLVGQHLGANQPRRATRATWAGFILTWTYMSSVAALYYWKPELFVKWFSGSSITAEDPQLAERVSQVTCWLLQFVAAYCLFDSMNIIFSSALRGAGDTVAVTRISAGLALPLLVIPSWASWYWNWGLGVAWMWATIYVIVLALVFLRRFLKGDWQLMRVIESAVHTRPVVSAGDSVC
jgi:MATE family multidrug resistance protein